MGKTTSIQSSFKILLNSDYFYSGLFLNDNSLRNCLRLRVSFKYKHRNNEKNQTRTNIKSESMKHIKIC